MLDVLMWGGQGQAKVLRPILEAQGHRIVLLYDRDPALGSPFPDLALLSDEAALQERLAAYPPGRLGFALAIGGIHGAERCALAARLKSQGLQPISALHARAWVADSARLGAGCQILAMAAVCEEAVLGDYCIVNTSASVDHECVLGDGVHVMPGATLAGGVQIDDHATIGSNATILPRLRIGSGAVVGAGAVVTADVAPGACVAGVPARPVSAKGDLR